MYPVGTGLYDYMVTEGKFKNKSEFHGMPEHISNFNSAYLEHYHYSNGVNSESSDARSNPMAER